jgi:hypothetical protein
MWRVIVLALLLAGCVGQPGQEHSRQIAVPAVAPAPASAPAPFARMTLI